MNFKKYHVSRNLFDKSKRTDNSRVVYTSGEIGALNGVFVSDFTSIDPNTTYTFNIVSSISGKTGHLFALYDENKNFVNTGSHEATTATVYTFTTPSDVAYIRFNGDMSSVDSIMLNEGSTALPYEPYGNSWTNTPHYIHNTSTDTITNLPADIYTDGTAITSYTIKGNTVQSGAPTPTSPIPVQGVGDLVESGEHAGQYAVEITNNGSTVATLYTNKPLYGTGTNLDYLQRLADGSGVEHRAWGVYVFNGTENAEFRKLDSVYRYSVRIGNSIHIPQSKCTHFTWSTVSGGTQNHFYITDAQYLHLFSVDLTTVEAFKSYLAAQYAAGTPVTVIYPLATPTDTPVALPEIQTAAGANVIDVDATVQPSEVTVNYKGWHPVADVHERNNGAWT